MTDPILDTARELMTCAEKVDSRDWVGKDRIISDSRGNAMAMVNLAITGDDGRTLVKHIAGCSPDAIRAICRALIARTEALRELVDTPSRHQCACDRCHLPWEAASAALSEQE